MGIFQKEKQPVGVKVIKSKEKSTKAIDLTIEALKWLKKK